MKRYMSLLIIVLIILISNVSYAAFNVEQETAIVGQKFNIYIKSDIALGAYVVEIENYGKLRFITSLGQEGSGKTVITGVSTTGEKNLAKFTFEVPENINMQNETIKIRAYSMETPNLEKVLDQEVIETIQIKQDFETTRIKEFKNNNKSYIAFSLEKEEDILTIDDIKRYYPTSNIEVNKTCLVNGDILKIDGNEYRVVIYGDINCDGEITIFDAVKVLNYVKSRENLTEEQKFAAEIGTNGQIDIMSAVKILNIVRGKIDYKQIV